MKTKQDENEQKVIERIIELFDKEWMPFDGNIELFDKELALFYSEWIIDPNTFLPKIKKRVLKILKEADIQDIKNVNDFILSNIESVLMKRRYKECGAEWIKLKALGKSRTAGVIRQRIEELETEMETYELWAVQHGHEVKDTGDHKPKIKVNNKPRKATVERNKKIRKVGTKLDIKGIKPKKILEKISKEFSLAESTIHDILYKSKSP